MADFGRPHDLVGSNVHTVGSKSNTTLLKFQLGDQPSPSDAKAVPVAPLTNKEKYRALKRRFKFLVYENEFYQEEMRNQQRKLMKLSRDRNFLLDRLLMYQRPSDSSDESDSTQSKKVKRTRTRKRDAQKSIASEPNSSCPRKARKSVQDANGSEGTGPSVAAITNEPSSVRVAANPDHSLYAITEMSSMK